MQSSGLRAVQGVQLGEMDGVSWMAHSFPSLFAHSGMGKVNLTRSAATLSTSRYYLFHGMKNQADVAVLSRDCFYAKFANN